MRMTKAMCKKSCTQLKVVRLDFDFEYCEESLIPKCKLFYDIYHEKYVAENSESSCLCKQVVKCCEIIIV